MKTNLKVLAVMAVLVISGAVIAQYILPSAIVQRAQPVVQDLLQITVVPDLFPVVLQNELPYSFSITVNVTNPLGNPDVVGVNQLWRLEGCQPGDSVKSVYVPPQVLQGDPPGVTIEFCTGNGTTGSWRSLPALATNATFSESHIITIYTFTGIEMIWFFSAEGVINL